MSLKLNSSGGGSVTLQEPVTASTLTLNIPAVTGTVITTADSGTVSSTMIAASAVTPAKLSQPLTIAATQNTTSGTFVDFTGIPSWVRRITVMFNGVSTNGSSFGLVQLGDSGGIENTGYTGSVAFSGGSSAGANPTNGFGFGNNSAVQSFFGHMLITNVSGNIWVASSLGGSTNTNLACMGGGNKTLSDVLTQLRITTVNGTDTFDAGSVNIMYEG